ncbi:Prenylcysteine oxidase [Cryphonectria parasitica EP155]|uniref:Prenylcysteine oxidase n=1 Tax=Cryphonectria parasitica (strain ATCC 38755 / EP155) TaxID=660469 RepID=A0A9P4XYW9_CRYP1|nr:Prenylcysteine oxidase [Cryphonectria parasitica EP155]KAF3763456.1 Prenylcysteine oxidase [Cryphonectria parasitica EP155]
MRWLDSIKAAIPGLLASPGAQDGASSQTVLEDAPSSIRQVAIIGAGAAGSSAAFHLSRYAAAEGVDVNITLFEKTGHIGGRSLTVDAYGNASEPVELGASIFVEANQILWNASQLFGLELRDPYTSADRLTAIWDGDEFVFETSAASSWWWDMAKLVWKYRLAPYYAQKLMQNTVATFLKLYEEPYFPFRSLSTRAFELDLAKVTGVTGQQFLEDNGISSAFAKDIVQAATRVNYASNLDAIHGLDTMVSMAPEGAKAVLGGNWRIFDHMVAASGAQIALNTSVSSIALGTKTGAAHPKYLINTKSVGNTAEVPAGVAFDNVIIAAPYQFTNIDAPSEVLQTTIDKVPYVKLHVTLFASPFAISPAFLGLQPGAKVPTTVLTTYAPTADGSSGLEGAGKTGFFSVSTLRTITNPKSGKEEVLYKIFSPMEVTPEFLSSLLGVDVPRTFAGTIPAQEGDEETIVEPVSWYYPHVFYSYPKALPRVTFQDPILGNGVYYTSGMDSFISTMETNALMGKNVARLIVDDILGLSTGNPLDTGEVEESMMNDEEVVKDEEPAGSQAKIDEL